MGALGCPCTRGGKCLNWFFPWGEVGELDLNFHTLGTVELKYMMMTILFGVY